MGAVTIVLKDGESALHSWLCRRGYFRCKYVAKCVIRFVITCATKCVRQSVCDRQSVYDKVYATKCVRQSVCDEVCATSVQQSVRQGVRQSVRQSVLNIHLHTKAKGVQYTTDKVCDKGATYIQRQGPFMH